MPSLPTSPPVHTGLSESELLGFAADSAQQIITGTAPTLPASPPIHSGLSEGQLLGYLADSAQDAAS